MSKYRVTLRTISTVIVDAENPYQAAVVAADRHGAGAEITDVHLAAGRASSTRKSATKKATTKPNKTAAKKRRPMSAEARAKLAKNLVKACAARARNLKATKKQTGTKTAKKAPAKRSVKKVAKRR